MCTAVNSLVLTLAAIDNIKLGLDDDDDDNSCNTVIPRNMVCLGNVCINTLHKGDNNDDDYDDGNNK